MAPNLFSCIVVLAGQYHLSPPKIRSQLKEELGTTFSVGAISEAHTKVTSMLPPLHHAIRNSIQTASLVHVEEASQPRNSEESLHWRWLVANEDLVYKKILFSHSAKAMLGANYSGLVVTDQCQATG